MAAVFTTVAMIASAAEPSGDPIRGEAIYARCGACHSLDVDRTGPRHCGLFGRRAGTVAGFPYSEAMKRLQIVWSKATLSKFLENPLATVPGTTMGFAIPDVQERADLIAFLERANGSPQCR